ncbi:MAG TPA: hypothetical protein VK968_02915 [Roseimicrobium sp.]|nr:hypothetical protein [Roseimicrobium sp.]
MGLPTTPQTLTPEQIAELNSKLSTLRHNINNNLALIVAAVELIRRKPEAANRMLDAIGDQPGKISEEMKKYSVEFERIIGIRREP